MIYSDNTFDITNNIATYTRRDFNSVFDTTSNKWYSLVNGEYIEDATQAAAPIITSLWGSKIFRDSNQMFKLYRNDAEQAKWSYMEDNILKKGEALPDFPYEVTDFSKNGTSNTIPIYGLMIKVGYPVSGDYHNKDLSFTTTQGATSAATDIVHINLIYQNGSYSDTRHSPAIYNALISTLPTIEYNGVNYYYYIFAVGNLYYNKYY